MAVNCSYPAEMELLFKATAGLRTQTAGDESWFTEVCAAEGVASPSLRRAWSLLCSTQETEY